MAALSIFVSYYSEDTTYPDYQFATQLIKSLRTKGAEVVAANAAVSDYQAPQHFYEQLAHCQWFILILTPEALQSRLIRQEVEGALKMTAQQSLRGVLALMPVPCALTAMPPVWSTIRMYDASEDYPRALAGILLALNLVRLQAPPPVKLPAQETPSRMKSVKQLLSSRFQDWQNRKYLYPSQLPSTWRNRRALLATLAITLAFIVILTSILISHSRAITGKQSKPGTPTASTSATATNQPVTPQSLYTSVTSKPPTVNDPMSAQDSNKWDETTSNMGSCAFVQGAYFVSINAHGGYTECIERAKSFSNFAYQVQMRIVTGDVGGLIFRTNSAIKTYYRFSLDTEYQGRYRLLACSKCSTPDLAQNLYDKALPVKINQPYIITVIALKNVINLYVNGQFLIGIPDETAQSGKLGVYAVDLTHSTQVVFSNMKVWALSEN